MAFKADGNWWKCIEVLWTSKKKSQKEKQHGILLAFKI